MAERFVPRAQEIYRHFKGDLYQVKAVAEHTETGESLVIYQAMYGDFKIYARPLDMFVEAVDKEKYPEAGQEFRFQLQGPEAARQRGAARGGDDRPQETVGAVPGTAQPSGENPEAAQPSGENPEAAQPGGESPEAAQPGGESSEAAQPGGEGPKAAQPEPEVPGIDPLVLEFLDARTYEQRLNVLAALHHRITNEMITTMSLCCDIEVEGNDVEQRYEELKQCLIMKDRFEVKRLG